MEGTASFGTWVRGRRRAADLTQAQLADAVSCAVITIRKIEADERRPSVQVAQLLADALHIGGSDRARFVTVARAEQSPLRLSTESAEPRWPEGLPAPVTALVGRDDLVAEAAEDTALLGGPARLTTLTGPPGVGKTRVAIAVAGRVARQADAPVVYVGLEGATDSAALNDALAAAVAARLPGATDALAALRREPTLVVLDNFEQIIDCAPDVSKLLAACPDVTCIVTSRLRLDLYGEHEIPIDPLPLPDPDETIDPATVDTWPALDLFVRRARAASRSLVFGRDQLHAAARICQLTDGIPLAIELSAAQLRRQSLDHLCSELEQSLGGLRSSARNAGARHETMVDAVQWSYELLDPSTQRVLRAVVLFPAGFTVTGATATLSPDPAPAEVHDALDRLTDHGLVRAIPCYGEPRFSAFEIVRAVVMETAVDPVERALDERRLRAYLSAMVSELGPQLANGSDETQTAPLVDEHDNVRWLLHWALADGNDPHLGAQLVRALHQFWQLRNLFVEGTTWARRVLEAASRDESRSHLESGDEAAAQHVIGMFAWSTGDIEVATAMLGAAVTSARAANDEETLADALGIHGISGFFLGDPEAIAHLEESLELYERHGYKSGISVALIRLGTVALRSGNVAEAERRYGEALEFGRAIDNSWGIATALSNLGDVRGMTGDWEAALDLRRAGFEQMLRTGSAWYSTTVLAGIGHSLFGLGHPRAAAQCYGIVERVLADLHMPMFPISSAAWEQGRVAVAAVLDEDFDIELRNGWSIPMTVGAVDALIAEALGT